MPNLMSGCALSRTITKVKCVCFPSLAEVPRARVREPSWKTQTSQRSVKWHSRGYVFWFWVEIVIAILEWSQASVDTFRCILGQLGMYLLGWYTELLPILSSAKTRSSLLM